MNGVMKGEQVILDEGFVQQQTRPPRKNSGNYAQQQTRPITIISDEAINEKFINSFNMWTFLGWCVVAAIAGYWLWTVSAFWNITSLPIRSNGFLSPALASIWAIGVSASFFLLYPFFQSLKFIKFIYKYFKYADVEHSIWGRKTTLQLQNLALGIVFIVLLSTTEFFLGYDFIKNPYGPTPGYVPTAEDIKTWNVNHDANFLMNAEWSWIHYPSYIGGNIGTAIIHAIVEERVTVKVDNYGSVEVLNVTLTIYIIMGFFWIVYISSFLILLGYPIDKWIYLRFDKTARKLSQKKTLALGKLYKLGKSKPPKKDMPPDYSPINIPVVDEIIVPASVKPEEVPVVEVPVINLPQETPELIPELSEPPNTISKVINQLFVDNKKNVSVASKLVIYGLRCWIIPLNRPKSMTKTDLSKPWITEEASQRVSEWFFRVNPNCTEQFNPTATIINYRGAIALQIDRFPTERKFVTTRSRFAEMVSDLLKYKKAHPGSTPFIGGMRSDSSLIVMELRKALHLIVQGGTGSGKGISHYQRLFAMLHTTSPSRLALMIIDYKGEFAGIFNNTRVPHIMSSKNNPLLAIRNHEKSLKFLDVIIKEMETRLELIANSGKGDIYGIGKPVKEYIVLIPELTRLLDKTRKTKEQIKLIGQIESKLNELLSMSRACGIYVWADTQEATKENTLAGLSNMQSRFCMKTDEYASRFLKTSNAVAPTTELQGAGDFYFRIPGENVSRGHTFLTDPNGPDPEFLLKLIKQKWLNSTKK